MRGVWCKSVRNTSGATRGVMVSTSAFLASICHPPMLGCRFESRLGLEFQALVYMAFSEARHQGFSPGTPVSSPSSSASGSANEIKLK